MSTDLSQFELRQSDDDVKRDLELICTACLEHLCDAEPTDSLMSLAGTAAGHVCSPLLAAARVARAEWARAGNGTSADDEHAAAGAMYDVLAELIEAVTNLHHASRVVAGAWAEGDLASAVAHLQSLLPEANDDRRGDTASAP